MKSVVYFFILYYMFAGLWSCQNETIIPEVNTPEESRVFNYLALGDSYTIGHGEMQARTFPFLLQEKLRAENLQFGTDPKVIARTGWTCDELAAAIAKDSTLKAPYDLVTLLIGVNDQYRGFDIGLYPGRFKKLLDKAIALAGNKAENVIVVSIPDYGATPFGKQRNPQKIGNELDAYNAINKEITLANGANYVYITDLSRLADGDDTLLVSDKLHPSGKMYALWVDRIFPVALRVLKP